MRRKQTSISMLAAALLVSSPCVLAAATATAKSGGSSLSPADKNFILETAGDNLQEIELGHLVQHKASSNEVKTFGQRMIDDHSKASAELDLLASGKGLTLPRELKPEQKEAIDKLSSLSGSEFDRQYMQYMVKDHTKGLQDFQKESAQGQDPEIKAFAAKLVPILEDHLRMARNISH
jgi:putative membrane protein